MLRALYVLNGDRTCPQMLTYMELEAACDQALAEGDRVVIVEPSRAFGILAELEKLDDAELADMAKLETDAGLDVFITTAARGRGAAFSFSFFSTSAARNPCPSPRGGSKRRRRRWLRP